MLEYLRFFNDIVRGTFGIPAAKLERPEKAAMYLFKMTRCNVRRVPANFLPSYFGQKNSCDWRPQMRLSPSALYDVLHGEAATCGRADHGSWRGSLKLGAKSHFPPHCVPIFHAALRDLIFWRGLRGTLHHKPVWPTVTVHIDVSMTAYGDTLPAGGHDPGSPGFYETPGF